MASMKMMTALMLAISAVSASPFPAAQLVARQDAGMCRNQSCEVATIAGSTGRTVYPYSTYPTGDTKGGDCCIVRYFPAAKDEVYAHRPGLKEYCAAHGGDAPKDKNPPGIDHVSIASRDVELVARQDVDQADCKANILIFIKGTFEPGELGVTVGPALQKKLDKNLWAIVGVDYDNSLDNDFCLGLPGGINVRNALASYAQACPNSQIALSGYSQGAMVVRHALARGEKSAVARVKNLVTFGDPFIGAPIGQYDGPVHVFCMAKDGVCNGQLDIGAAHLSYAGSADVTEAVDILMATEKKSL